MKAFGFEIAARDGKARTGRVTTAHGTFATPAFMPVGTAATVKGMSAADVAATGAEIVLGNTYHLGLRPGAENVAKLGGLHRFMNWPGPILTDSGGFQVMSLAKLRKLTDKGVTFQSHIDGATIELTPERSIEIQHLLDSDITMVLDECPAYGADKAAYETSLALTLAWAKRSKDAFKMRPGYALFGIVQGGVFEDLRKRSVVRLQEIGFDGYAIGGLAVGEGQEAMFATLDMTMPHVPADKPHYLMGVGTPDDILGAVERGIDMFDCVMPTRSGRTGKGFTRRGEINIRNARHALDPRPLDAECRCDACTGYSRAYINHLFKADEMLGAMLLTRHNLTYYQDLMRGIRAAIADGKLAAFAASARATWALGDIESLA